MMLAGLVAGFAAVEAADPGEPTVWLAIHYDEDQRRENS